MTTPDAPCGFHYPSGFICGRRKSKHAAMKHEWEPAVSAWPLRGSMPR